MTVSSYQTEVFVIADAPNLDTITLYPRDYDCLTKGKIVIECHDRAWTAYWGSIPHGKGVFNFIATMDTEYIVDCLNRTPQYILDTETGEEKESPEYRHLYRVVKAIQDSIEKEGIEYCN